MLNIKVKKMELGRALNRKHRKENGFYKSIIACIIECNKINIVLRVRFYATKNRVYCCIWLSHKGVYASGSDWVDGYGYHMESAAFAQALKSAGITLNTPISGVGGIAIEEAMKAVVRKITGKRKVTLITENA